VIVMYKLYFKLSVDRDALAHSPPMNVSPETHRQPVPSDYRLPELFATPPTAFTFPRLHCRPIVVTLVPSTRMNRSVSSDEMPRCPTYAHSYNRTSPDTRRKQILGFDFRGSDSARRRSRRSSVGEIYIGSQESCLIMDAT
jgi:hypothetical protein